MSSLFPSLGGVSVLDKEALGLFQQDGRIKITGYEAKNIERFHYSLTLSENHIITSLAKMGPSALAAVSSSSSSSLAHALSPSPPPTLAFDPTAGYSSVQATNPNIVIKPQQCVIVQSNERVSSVAGIYVRTLPIYGMAIYGIHSTANEMKSGVTFQPTFILFNMNPFPVLLKSGMPIGMLEFYGPAERPAKKPAFLVKVEGQKPRLKKPTEEKA